MRVGVVQMQSTEDHWYNLLQVASFVEEAVSAGCEMVSFPENTFYRGPSSGRPSVYLSRDADKTLKKTSEFSGELKELFQSWTIPVCLGSVVDTTNQGENPHNSHWVVMPGGKILNYSKIHLFHFSSGTRVYQETSDFTAGESVESFSSGGFHFGLSICYDLRFPELFRHLSIDRKTNALLIPSAFLQETGLFHWHILVRARAIENLSYVLAAGQWGSHVDTQGKETFCFGHSLIIDPWGEVLAEAPPKGDALLVAELDQAMLTKRRTQLPALSNTKLFQSKFLKETSSDS